MPTPTPMPRFDTHKPIRPKRAEDLAEWDAAPHFEDEPPPKVHGRKIEKVACAYCKKEMCNKARDYFWTSSVGLANTGEGCFPMVIHRKVYYCSSRMCEMLADRDYNKIRV